ncbi:MAG TPA: sugar phosphate isomerase/epimerase family protein [Urbifossiella sp.]|jgi:sugar phosphate isomerase/epimerase|nr:sugar phosphate isomerase/epimerase family protein [Urbifossiella sp.]
MTPTRRAFLATGLVTAAARADDPPSPAANLGLLLYSFGIRARQDAPAALNDPLRFIAFARSRGANAVQLSLGRRTEAEAAAVRRAAEAAGVAVEGIVGLPDETAAGRERFAAELATSRGCGVSVVRVVLLGGRRYEVFTQPDQYPAFARSARATLERAEPVARAAGVKLAVENHKDFRTDELLDLLKGLASPWVGVCVDTGNSLALLEDPAATIADLAPLAFTVHLKDMGLEEAGDGFRLSEVPLGQGVLDLPAVVAALRKGNPRVRFQLEMITRDPLSIPCLTDRYWATLGRVPGRDLARTLALARRSAAARKEPLPRISQLPPADQVAAEDRNVRESFAFAARTRLLPA